MFDHSRRFPSWAVGLSRKNLGLYNWLNQFSRFRKNNLFFSEACSCKRLDMHGLRVPQGSISATGENHNEVLLRELSPLPI